MKHYGNMYQSNQQIVAGGKSITFLPAFLLVMEGN